MATVAQVLDKIASLERKIHGIKNAYDHDEVPSAVRGLILPAFVNVGAGANYTPMAHAHAVIGEARRYILLLYVAPIELPSDIAFKMDLVEPFKRRVIDGFKDYPMLDGLDGVAHAYIAGDGGIEPLEFAGKQLAGIQFVLMVEQYLT